MVRKPFQIIISAEYLNMRSYLLLVMPFHRRRRRVGRMSGMNPIQSYKQITIDGPASRAAATNISHNLVLGVDNYTGPDATNRQVPTGAKILGFLIFLSFTNLVSVSALLHLNVQILRAGQSVVTPGTVGGNAQRNQVVFTMMKFLGQNQNSNFQVFIKIPQLYQRVREGDVWDLTYRCDAVFASATQAIYKFYR